MSDMCDGCIREQATVPLCDRCPSKVVKEIISNEIFPELLSDVRDDAIAYSNKDPASRIDTVKIINNYTSFKAVMHYRISNAILKLAHLNNEIENFSFIN